MHIDDLKDKSPAMQVLSLVWEHSNKGVAHSWERLNHAMWTALSLVIGAGFLFREDDMATIANSFRFGYWCGETPEWIYTTAVNATNVSAAKSYEAWKNRKPFIADNVGYAYHGRGPYMHGGSDRQRDRLTVNSVFKWKGYKVTVTSFSDDQLQVIACSYKDSSRNKVEKRFRITREDLLADRAERKERDQILKALGAHTRKHSNLKEVQTALGVTTNDELDRLPVAKLRSVVEQFKIEVKPAKANKQKGESDNETDSSEE
jgi:hypothetical protein